MAIYDKPTRVLMHEMVQTMGLKQGDTVSKQQVLNWFSQNYPKIKPGTIAAHLIRMSTNAPSRTHHPVIVGADDLFFQLDRSNYRLYDAESDPAPISARDHELEVESELDDLDTELAPVGSAEFAYEADLKNYLAKNLSVLESGLVLFEDEGITGVEFPAGGRFIDILATDADNNYVVIELKVSRGYDRTIGQLMRYMVWIAENHADPDQRVRGIIVAREIGKDLVLACKLVEDVALYEYQLSLEVRQVK